MISGSMTQIGMADNSGPTSGGEGDEPVPTDEERRGYRGSLKIGRVADERLQGIRERGSRK
jgi:hypothetical protein